MRKFLVQRADFLCFVLAIVLAIHSRCFALSESAKDSKSYAHFIMGIIYDRQDNLDLAISELKHSLEYDPEEPYIHLKLGGEYLRQGKDKEALEELKFSSRLNPDDFQARLLLTLLYTNLKKFDQAALEYEELLKRASALEPNNIDIYRYLGRFYFQQKKYLQAEEQFKLVSKIDPKDANSHFYLGTIYEETNRRKEAIEEFKLSIESDPNFADSLNSLGYLYAEEGIKLSEAEKLVKKALEIDSSNGAYVDSLGWVYFKQNKFSEAVKQLELAASLLDDSIIQDHLGDSYLKIGDSSKAINAFKHSLELDPKQEKVKEKLKLLENK